MCTLGDRLLNKGNYTCSKNESDPRSLYHLYCAEVNKTETGEPVYDCDSYFASNDVSLKKGIPGIANNAFHCKFFIFFFIFKNLFT